MIAFVRSRRFYPTPHFSTTVDSIQNTSSSVCVIGKLQSPCAVVLHCLYDTKFNHFNNTPTCVRQADVGS